MSKKLYYFFDYVSPYTYLAQTQLAKLQEETGAEIVYIPILLGALHNSAENKSPVFVPNKARWINQDCMLWADKYQVPMVWNKQFPFNSIFLLRSTIWLQQHQPENVGKFVNALFKAIWEKQLNVNSEQDISAYIQELGFDIKMIIEGGQGQYIKDKLKENTEFATKEGFFGAPGFKVNDRIFFGQDRLEFVKSALLEN